jgi:hypothetical protein
MTDSNTRLVRPAGQPRAADRADTGALKAVVRDTLHLDADHTIVVQQLACAEPGCPPVETVIAVLSATAPAQRWTLHQPLSDLTADALRAALTQGEHQ